ncbi:hydroxyacid dehydrogenase [Pelagibius sp. CAU 1746]|uniref:hydroxyacid dehydrogenase n=1 Tax=Pelagibius sp. CAU 1746 TaxID=3140370 RepID=UPI00325AFB50
MSDIVISEFMDADAVEGLSKDFDLLYDPELVDRPDDLRAAVAGARALIVRNRTRVTGEVLAAAPNLVCVGRLGVGLDNIDLEACTSRGVAVLPATGANDQAVAEYVIAAALLLLRGAYHAGADMLSGAWPRQALMGREVAGKTLGLVGCGGIARQVAVRARALGMAVAAVDPFVAEADPAWQEITRHETLESLLPAVDVLSLHVPLTEDTRGLVGAAALRRMRPGAVVVNTSRGGVVDEAALAASLKSGHLGGAALDVFEEEPLGAEAASVFAGLSNLILTPHIAGVTVEANVRVSALTARQVRAALEETA